MRRSLVGISITTAALAVTLVAAPVNAGTSESANTSTSSTSSTTASAKVGEYVVLYAKGVSPAQGRAALARLGATVLRENTTIGSALISTRDARFADRVAADAMFVGAARNRPIGKVPERSKAAPAAPKADRRVEQPAAASDAKGTKDATGSKAIKGTQTKGNKSRVRADPLADLQWDMEQIGATADGSYRVQDGDRRVRVGIIDSGIDGSHPDLNAVLDRRLSRNFVTDIPFDPNGEEFDGPCEYAGCVDPVDVDNDGHGTHVASTVAAPLNGIGTAGVAPGVTLVNIRGGQDAGYLFLQPVVDAITYAGDIQLDVINMSFYIDPWLYNCVDNPADSPTEQREQRTVREATQRAIDYARSRGVLPVGSAGNGATDKDIPASDSSSPDFPIGSERDRAIDNTCITVPSETRGVVGVTATGISERKSYYSDYGFDVADVSAPGGDAYDTADNRLDITKAVLAAYPLSVLRDSGEVDANGNVTTPSVVKSCKGRTCGYYRYLQGTSMASPHASGVAALVVSQYGKERRGNFGLPAATTEDRLLESARDHGCAAGGAQTYTRIIRNADGTERTVTATHKCRGGSTYNSHYGAGIVDALRAVSASRR